MNEKTRAQKYIAERDAGLTYREIAEKYGVSRQAVCGYCAKRSVGHFRAYKEEDVVYPVLRKWLNENKVARSEVARRMGIPPDPSNTQRIAAWFRGKAYPTKRSIDKLLAATGLTYEQLFYREDE